MEIYGLTFLEGRSWKQGVGRTVLPPGALWDNSGEASFSIWWLQMFVSWWPHRANLGLTCRVSFSSVSRISLSLSLIRTLSWDLGPSCMISGNLISRSLTKLRLQTLFPNKVTFRGSGVRTWPYLSWKASFTHHDSQQQPSERKWEPPGFIRTLTHSSGHHPSWFQSRFGGSHMSINLKKHGSSGQSWSRLPHLLT